MDSQKLGQKLLFCQLNSVIYQICSGFQLNVWLTEKLNQLNLNQLATNGSTLTRSSGFALKFHSGKTHNQSGVSVKRLLRRPDAGPPFEFPSVDTNSAKDLSY